MKLLRKSSGSARRSRGSMRSGKSWLGSSPNWRRPSVYWRAIAKARRERSRPSRRLHQPRRLLQRSGNAAAGPLRPRNQLTVVAPRRPSAIRCLPWQPAERSRKSPPLARGFARHHVGAAISRHKRAGRIEERDGKLYASQATDGATRRGLTRSNGRSRSSETAPTGKLS